MKRAVTCKAKGREQKEGTHMVNLRSFVSSSSYVTEPCAGNRDRVGRSWDRVAALPRLKTTDQPRMLSMSTRP